MLKQLNSLNETVDKYALLDLSFLGGGGGVLERKD
jgi:hypothetical protein